MIKPYENEIQACMQAFDRHGVVLYPTDTIWGLGCKADDEKAIQKIFQIKQRSQQKSFVLLMTDVKQLSRYIASPPPDLESILEKFTSPTTVIYPSAINLTETLFAKDGSIAVRITKDPFCRSLIKRMRVPLVSTSANISGEQHPSCFTEISSDILTSVDYVVRWRQEESGSALPSSMFKLGEHSEMIKVR